MMNLKHPPGIDGIRNRPRVDRKRKRKPKEDGKAYQTTSLPPNRLERKYGAFYGLGFVG